MRSGWKLAYGAGLIKRAGIYAAQTIAFLNLFLPEGGYKPPREGSMARVPLGASASTRASSPPPHRDMSGSLKYLGR